MSKKSNAAGAQAPDSSDIYSDSAGTLLYRFKSVLVYQGLAVGGVALLKPEGLLLFPSSWKK